MDLVSRHLRLDVFSALLSLLSQENWVKSKGMDMVFLSACGYGVTDAIGCLYKGPRA